MLSRTPPLARCARFAVLLVVVVTMAACTVLFTISMEASCSGVTPAELRAAIASDRTIEIRDFTSPGPHVVDGGPGREVLSLWATRDSIVVHVMVREAPDVVTLVTGGAAPPENDTERAQWLRSVEYVAERIDDACPAVAAWKTVDSTRSRQWPGVVCLAAVALLIGGAVWLVRRDAFRHSETSARDDSPGGQN